MTSIKELAEQVIVQREAVKGMPAEGPYPASVEEVADELVEFILELDRTCAIGIAILVHDKLYQSREGEDW